MSCPIPSIPAERLTAMLGLTAEQCDTILRLICLPENGMTEWWKHYAYIEYLNDGRGYTCTIFGACSGTQDLCMIFDELERVDASHPLLKYHAALKKAKGNNVNGLKGLVKDLPNHDDESWRTAVWKVYIDLYWSFVARWCTKEGECSKRPGPVLTSIAAKGFMVDTAINHGADFSSVMHVVNKMKKPHELDEKSWLVDFMKTRRKILKSGYEDLDTSGTGDRCKLWLALLDQGNTNLTRPIRAYKGYWGSKSIE